MQVTLTPRQTTTVLDCSNGAVHFSEASRGPNGAYYFLADESPYSGTDLKLMDQVYQHDIFVAYTYCSVVRLHEGNLVEHRTPCKR